MGTKERLLELFEARKGSFLSGEEIAQTLSVSRTAVWKAVNALRQEGYPIEAATNRGYCLGECADVLSEQGVRRFLGQDGPQLELTVLPSVDSTNTWVRDRAALGAPEGCVVMAGEQTAGRGRRGRTFYSPKDTGVYMSLLLRPEFPAECAPRITIAAALGVCRALRTFGADAAIKWPNDVYAGGKKLSGILSELGTQGGGRPYIVCGIGINVGQRAFPGELAETATSLLLETGHTVALERVISEVLCALAPLFPACGEDAAYAALM